MSQTQHWSECLKQKESSDVVLIRHFKHQPLEKDSFAFDFILPEKSVFMFVKQTDIPSEQ